jgi:hypothetical protein
VVTSPVVVIDRPNLATLAQMTRMSRRDRGQRPCGYAVVLALALAAANQSWAATPGDPGVREDAAQPKMIDGTRSLVAGGGRQAGSSVQGGGTALVVQAVKLSQGTTYEVSFRIAGARQAQSPPSVMVHASGVRKHLTGASGGDWSRVGFRFQAPRTGTDDLKITAASGDVRVEDVSVRAVHESGSLPLLLGGLVWIGLLLNRRRPEPMIPRLRAG